ncbi:MAG TPA: putative 2-aminoethylphosphonate ABC transporter substrate-binding protein, partial [Pseudomonadales bacterium]
LLALATPLSATAGELTIYAAIDADKLDTASNLFSARHPDIKINWVRDSTGIIHARLMAEKDNPRADVVFGMAATSMLTMDAEGMFLPYTPAGVERLDPKYRDKREPNHWVGIYGWAGAICFNTIEAEKHGLPAPKSWMDLLDPVYAGHVTMPNPASSGTGFLDVSAWIQIFGEKEAWDYMDKLHNNIAAYTHSGSKPCNQAASGEYTVGVSWPYRGALLKEKGAPIEVIVPVEGVGWEMQAVAIMNGTQNLDDARTFLDWSISDEAMQFYSETASVVARSDLNKPRPFFPEEVLSRMIDNDFAKMAAQKDEIIAEWRGRYESKSEPKQ